MIKIPSAFAADESGATAVEYGLLLAFIAVAVIVVVESVGLSLQGTLLELKTALGSSAASG